MKIYHLILIQSAFLLFLNSCITIGVSKDPQPAKNLELKAPSKPFSEMKTKSGDQSWISSQTNNVISYLSDCSPSQDPSLDQLEQEALSSLERVEFKSREEISYNQRLAKSTIAEGFIDGVKIKIQVISFKKNSCSYSLIYGGQATRFDSEVQEFNLFKNGFKAP